MDKHQGNFLSKIEEMPEFDDHRLVTYVQDYKTGLRGFIAIHRGGMARPSFGATRLWFYESETEALQDVLRLSRLMSYKSAMAGLPYGGAKGVIIHTQRGKNNRKSLLKKYAEKVNFLNNHFITGTDAGLTQEDVIFMSKITPSIVGINVDPTKFTATGLLASIKLSLKTLYGSGNITGRTFAIQGVGKIGTQLISLLHEDAKVIYVADIDGSKIKIIKQQYPKVQSIDQHNIYRQIVDVFSPCALSHSINLNVIPELRCKIVVGGANNRLDNGVSGELLLKRDILYAPDYVVNAGGLISVVDEYEHRNVDETRITKRISLITNNLKTIYDQSKRSNRPTNEIADEMAQKIFNKME